MSLGPGIAQSAVIQSSAIHTPAASERSEQTTTWSKDHGRNVVPKTRVARHDTIGNHGICGFAPQTAAERGTPISQSETGKACAVGQVHASNRLASVDSGELRSVNSPKAQRFVHDYPVRRAIGSCPAPGGGVTPVG